jgi:hypothetical protein
MESAGPDPARRHKMSSTRRSAQGGPAGHPRTSFYRAGGDRPTRIRAPPAWRGGFGIGRQALGWASPTRIQRHSADPDPVMPMIERRTNLASIVAHCPIAAGFPVTPLHRMPRCSAPRNDAPGRAPCRTVCDTHPTRPAPETRPSGHCIPRSAGTAPPRDRARRILPRRSPRSCFAACARRCRAA